MIPLDEVAPGRCTCRVALSCPRHGPPAGFTIGAAHPHCSACGQPIAADAGHLTAPDGLTARHWPRCPRTRTVVSVPMTDLSDATLRELVDKGVINPAAPMPDMVNHPPHYTGHPSGIECITITRLCHFALGNAIKYVWRAWDKGQLAVDLDKSRFYLRDTLANGCAHHPHYKAKALLLEAVGADDNPTRAAMLHLLAHGQLDNVIRRIGEIID